MNIYKGYIYTIVYEMCDIIMSKKTNVHTLF